MLALFLALNLNSPRRVIKGRVAIAVHDQARASLILQKLDLGAHSGGVTVIRILSEFPLGEGLAAWSGSEPCEEESESGVAEEAILRLLAVLVHGVAHGRKVDQRVTQEVIVLVVPVGQHKHLDKLDELEACLLMAHFVEQAWELVLNKRNKRVHDGALVLVCLPFVEERLVG